MSQEGIQKRTVRIAIAGLGTVGIGVIKLLNENADLLKKRTGCLLEVVAISARSRYEERGGVNLSNYTWYDNPADFCNNPEIDVVIEVIGGADGIALDLANKTIQSGKAFITANKALMATHGFSLQEKLEQKKGFLGYEAAIAGGIPIVKGIREGLFANKIHKVAGILNGTCNYILSEIYKTGAPFEEILKEAQDKGYAEADPTFDIEGIDAGHKLSLLASVAFGQKVNFTDLQIEGISKVSALDVSLASTLDYMIKLIGYGAQNDSGQSEVWVAPCLVSKDSSLASIQGATNAVLVDATPVGQTLFVGEGAGEGPTASAIVADLIDYCLNNKRAPLGIPLEELLPEQKNQVQEYSAYIRLDVKDQVGALAEVTKAIEKSGLSIKSLHQEESTADCAHLILITHHHDHASHQKAISIFNALETVVSPPIILRILDL